MRQRGADAHPWLAAGLLLLLALAGCTGRVIEVREGVRIRLIKPVMALSVLRDSPEVPILDLRRRDEFYGPLGHIRGARNVPLEELPARLGELGDLRVRTFLVYCRAGDDCGLRGMEILVSNGFRDALLIDGGVDAWLARGMGTVEEETSPDSGDGTVGGAAVSDTLPPP